MYRKKQNNEKNTGEDILFDYFRENLEDLKLPVSDRCWENISQQITTDNLSAKRRKLVLTISSVAAILLIALLSGLYLHLSDNTYAPIVAEQIEKTQEEEINIQPITVDEHEKESQKEITIGDLDKSPSLVAQQLDKNIQSRTSQQNTNYQRENDSQSGSVPTVNPVIAQPEARETAGEATTIKQENAASNEEQTHLADNIVDQGKQDSIDAAREQELQNLYDLYNAQDEILVAELSDNKNGGKWGLSASFGSATSSSQAIHQTRPVNTLSISDVFLASKASNSKTDIDYAPPFSVGLTVSKQLNKTFSVETGLVYSYLSTKYKDLENNSYASQVKLHYLGIPVNISANIWEINSRFKVYASAGAMVEKGLRFNFSQDNIEDKQKVYENRSISGVQWSVNGSVGASYRFYDNWSIYVEPQVSYYFDNNQPISIRTEKNTIFSLNSGIRYQF